MTSLYCFVDKDGEILKVKVQIGDDIMDLKMSIHDEGISKVPSRHLVLWKVSTLTMSASMLRLTTLRSSTVH